MGEFGNGVANPTHICAAHEHSIKVLSAEDGPSSSNSEGISCNRNSNRIEDDRELVFNKKL